MCRLLKGKHQGKPGSQARIIYMEKFDKNPQKLWELDNYEILEF